LAKEFEDVDISSHIGSLKAENNILSVHAMNSPGNQADFLISDRLAAGGK